MNTTLPKDFQIFTYNVFTSINNLTTELYFDWLVVLSYVRIEINVLGFTHTFFSVISLKMNYLSTNLIFSYVISWSDEKNIPEFFTAQWDQNLYKVAFEILYCSNLRLTEIQIFS